jgi:hypothetical protein
VADTPVFLEMSKEEIGAWRDLATTKAFFEWVEWEIERGKDYVTDFVVRGEIDRARVSAGTLKALYNIRGSVERQEPLPDPDDEPFVDPAMRPSLRRKNDSQG